MTSRTTTVPYAAAARGATPPCGSTASRIRRSGAPSSTHASSTTSIYLQCRYTTSTAEISGKAKHERPCGPARRGCRIRRAAVRTARQMVPVKRGLPATGSLAKLRADAGDHREGQRLAQEVLELCNQAPRTTEMIKWCAWAPRLPTTHRELTRGGAIDTGTSTTLRRSSPARFKESWVRRPRPPPPAHYEYDWEPAFLVGGFQHLDDYYP